MLPEERQTEVRELLASTSQTFQTACKRLGLQTITLAIDKYGSYVWEAGKRGSLNRYVTLSLTPLGNTSKCWAIEMLYGADDDTSYVSFRDEYGTPTASEILAGGADNLLVPIIAETWKRCQRLTRDDLKEAYIVPRGTHPPAHRE